MFTRIVISFSLLVACGAAESPDAGGSGDGSESADASSDGGEALTHGKVVFEFRRAENQAADPSTSTASVSITMTYRDCLSEFYDANPGLRQTGPEGELIFGSAQLGGEGWLDRLCAGASCTVIAIEQRLEPVRQLTVTYGVPGTVENTTLAFGPLPTRETAGCNDPIVRASIGGTKGFDQEGSVVWEASSIEPLDAITDQGGALRVGIEAAGD